MRKIPNGKKIRVDAAIGDAIRKQRDRSKVTRERLAQAIGVDPSTLQKIECGEQGCSAFHLYELAHALDVTVDDLMPVLVDEPSEVSRV